MPRRFSYAVPTPSCARRLVGVGNCPNLSIFELPRNSVHRAGSRRQSCTGYLASIPAAESRSWIGVRIGIDRKRRYVHWPKLTELRMTACRGIFLAVERLKSAESG
jgi:hypothetical protein